MKNWKRSIYLRLALILFAARAVVPRIFSWNFPEFIDGAMVGALFCLLLMHFILTRYGMGAFEKIRAFKKRFVGLR